MVCPVFERKPQIQRPTEYPFEPLYRPWSWLLSSFSNVAIFAVLFLIVYVIIKRRRSGQRKKTVYRKVVVKTEEENEKVRVLVTGGSGCLGRALVKSLLQDGGYTVYSMDLTIPEENRRNPEVSAYLQLDVRDYEELEIALQEIIPEVVFHVAGLIPRLGVRDADLFAVNETGTKNVVEACKCVGVSRLIYTSTTDVVMSKDPNQVLDLADETTPLPCDPLDPYTHSKMNAENTVLGANGSGNLLTCAVRPSTIAAVDSAMCYPLLTTQAGYIGTGANRMTIVPVGACARGHILAEKKLRREGPKSVTAGRVYHLCGDDTYTLKDFVSYSLDKQAGTTIWGFPIPKSYPRWLVIGAAILNQTFYYFTGMSYSSYLTLSSVKFGTRSYTFSNARAHRELGWEKLPSWQQMVEEVVEQYKKIEEEKKDK